MFFICFQEIIQVQCSTIGLLFNIILLRNILKKHIAYFGA